MAGWADSFKKWKFDDFDETKWEDYLDALRTYGELAKAAATVGVNPFQVKLFRKDNPWFDALCEIALGQHNGELIERAKQLATEGHPKFQLGGRNRDQVIQVGTEVSETILMQLLRRADPTFRDKSEVEVTSNVNLAEMFDYGSLSIRARRKLREALKQIKEDEELSRHHGVQMRQLRDVHYEAGTTGVVPGDKTSEQGEAP